MNISYKINVEVQKANRAIDSRILLVGFLHGGQAVRVPLHNLQPQCQTAKLPISLHRIRRLSLQGRPHAQLLFFLSHRIHHASGLSDRGDSGP